MRRVAKINIQLISGVIPLRPDLSEIRDYAGQADPGYKKKIDNLLHRCSRDPAFVVPRRLRARDGEGSMIAEIWSAAISRDVVKIS